MSVRNGQHAGIVNVAILGCGRIAHHMADTLRQMATDYRYGRLIAPYAVATRNSQQRADEFATQYGFPKAYGSYEELLADPEVDLVYIATPHALHAGHAIACMMAGKNVLVEKSFTANTAQAEKVIRTAQQTRLLCTEAIWTRYIPSRALITEVIESGAIGVPHQAYANLSYPVSNKARMTDPAMAGGALLDVGVYPINFIDMAFPDAEPVRMISSCNFTDRGVAEQWCDGEYRFVHDRGGIAQGHYSGQQRLHRRGEHQ